MLAAVRSANRVATRGLSTAAASVFATPQDVADNEVVLVDCSGPDAYRRAHLKSAVRLPLAPSLKGQGSASVIGPDEATEMAAALGISRNCAVVAYDDNGGLNAARFWWVMSMYGKPHVRVLRKGWYGAVSDDFPVSLSPDVATQSFSKSLATEDPFVAEEQPGWRATLDDVARIAKETGGPDAAQLLDVRSFGEWDGKDLRGNPRGGHVEGSIHLPHSKLTNGFFSEEDAKTRELAKWAHLDLARPVVTYCQSGMRAAHTAMMLRAVGAPAAVFDESMFALTRDDGFELQTGRAGSRMNEL